MALPLLMLAGAGLLGGGQYLLSKMDEKREAGMLSDFREYATNSPLANSGMADGLLNQLESTADSSSLLGRTSSQTQSLINDFQQKDFAFQQAQVAGQQANGTAAFNAAMTQSSQLQDDYRTDFQQFAEYQNVVGGIKGALEANDSANTLASVFNFFNILEPGGIVRESESGQYRAQGGTSQQWANWMNDIQGKGLTAKTAKQIWGAVQNQYTPRYEQAQRKKGAYDRRLEELRAYGVNAINPSGSQGINWEIDPNETLALPGAPSQTTGEITEAAEAEANSRGRTLIDPLSGRRKSPDIRAKRGR